MRREPRGPCSTAHSRRDPRLSVPVSIPILRTRPAAPEEGSQSPWGQHRPHPPAPLIPASRRSFASLQDVLLLHTAVPSRLCPLIRPVCPRPLHMANSSPSDKTWTLSRGVPDERGSPLPLFRGALHRGLLALITRSCSVRSALHLQPPLGTRNPLRTDIKPFLFAVPEVSRGDTEA